MVDGVVHVGLVGDVTAVGDRRGAGRDDGRDRLLDVLGTTSRQATTAPSSARRMAVARPMPDPAPVTTAVRPSKRRAEAPGAGARGSRRPPLLGPQLVGVGVGAGDRGDEGQGRHHVALPEASSAARWATTTDSQASAGAVSRNHSVSCRRSSRLERGTSPGASMSSGSGSAATTSRAGDPGSRAGQVLVAMPGGEVARPPRPRPGR